MKAKSLEEIEALLDSEAFRTWWGDLESVRAEKREVELRLEEVSSLLFHMEVGAERDQRTGIDMVQDASESEHQVATLHAEADEMENRAIEKIGGFEEQRFRASDAWVKLGAVEKRLEEARDRLEGAKTAGGAEASRIQAEVDRLVREQRSAHETYERGSERKGRLWREVEKLWAEALGKGLLAAEREARNALNKRKAERLLRSSDQDLEEVGRLREEIASLEERLGELRDRVRHCNAEADELLGAISGEDFLYWPCKNSEKHVWCLSLTSDSESYNIEVAPRTIYRAKTKQGVAHLEPLQAGEVEDEHREDRIEAWFRRTGADSSGEDSPAKSGLVPDLADMDGDAEKATGG